MEIIVREYQENDIAAMVAIWNEVVEEGMAFPQIETLDESCARSFFEDQSITAVAELNEEIVGLYILHPNNVGRCGHIANASYAVKASARGSHIGEKLVMHSLIKGKELGFGILQFNAVVETNYSAIHLYEKLDFVKLGTIPDGFMIKDGTYKNIVLFYHKL